MWVDVSSNNRGTKYGFEVGWQQTISSEQIAEHERSMEVSLEMGVTYKAFDASTSLSRALTTRTVESSKKAM